MQIPHLSIISVPMDTDSSFFESFCDSTRQNSVLVDSQPGLASTKTDSNWQNHRDQCGLEIHQCAGRIIDIIVQLVQKYEGQLKLHDCKFRKLNAVQQLFYRITNQLQIVPCVDFLISLIQKTLSPIQFAMKMARSQIYPFQEILLKNVFEEAQTLLQKAEKYITHTFYE
ncbi:hypothetical protein SS50377_20652 [Spironucleus salmonicida]|uniref:Uncharacterized protein n=1 Tax=Spironucleus salmonicida TaxID=348837 RepID=V6LZ01_9EUKA|nr:hypothetical protein SS50377_20652 [Spironucleus salmonicida]|eukprot:EST49503.1 Hypothetical protein SS50377_10101 [Spironucleus salmonicida]